MPENVADDEQYLLAEEVAERLGLPLSVLLHRVEAGDIPSRRVVTGDGVHYALRLGDLGVELAEATTAVPAGDEGAAAVPAMIEHPGQVPLESGIVFQPDPVEATPRWSTRRREPQQPPPWVIRDEGLGVGMEGDSAAAELAVPPPGRKPDGLLDAAPGPRGELASMSLDGRELVAALLDRWERSLEQRIYTEQRQRFQAELVRGQGQVAELQMELQAVRAEHAAAQAQKDHELARTERELADRERALAELRERAETARERASTRIPRRLAWFRRRGA